MALIAWPTGIELANADWDQPPVEQVNRSPWSNRTRIAQFGAAARWSMSGDLPPMKDGPHLAWSAFALRLRGRVNVFTYPIGEIDQHAQVVAAKVAGGSFDLVLNLANLPATTTLARAGHYVTVALPSGDLQLIGLTSDLTSNAGGAATVALATPLRETPSIGASVETKRPYALLRAVNPVRWSVRPGRIYSRKLIAEEAF